jgi:hypothetical protein
MAQPTTFDFGGSVRTALFALTMALTLLLSLAFIAPVRPGAVVGRWAVDMRATEKAMLQLLDQPGTQASDADRLAAGLLLFSLNFVEFDFREDRSVQVNAPGLRRNSTRPEPELRWDIRGNRFSFGTPDKPWDHFTLQGDRLVGIVKGDEGKPGLPVILKRV